MKDNEMKARISSQEKIYEMMKFSNGMRFCDAMEMFETFMDKRGFIIKRISVDMTSESMYDLRYKKIYTLVAELGLKIELWKTIYQ